MGLFSRKVGGTLFGNILRGAASGATGGILGQGAMKITQEEADRRDMSDAQYLSVYGVNKSGVNPSVLPYLQQVGGAILAGGATGIMGLNNAGVNSSSSQNTNTNSSWNNGLNQGATNSLMGQYLKYIVPVISVVVLIVLYVKMKK